jgi:spore maturation protein CgeB
MKILLGFHYHEHPLDVLESWRSHLSRITEPGVEITPFPMTLQERGTKENWPVLDRKWRLGDLQLMRKYEALVKALDGVDVFLNYGAINVHPEFLQQLPTLNVMAHFDDPENSEQVSRPVANAYDLCLVGNVAEVDTYWKWGAREVEFWPLGFRDEDYDPALTEEKILTGQRDVSMTILCERDHAWRRARLDAVAAAFPQGHYHGLGWPAGFLPEAERVPLLQRTRVGINIHNSTGPINVRAYSLPANGVLQVCDNKSHLGRIFELGTEVVGFDHIQEGIDLARYYLAHEEERRQIAAAGFRRTMRDYNEKAVWHMAFEWFRQRLAARSARRGWSSQTCAILQQRHKEAGFARQVDLLASPVRDFISRNKRRAKLALQWLKEK